MLDNFENVHSSNLDAIDSVDCMVFSGDDLYTKGNIKAFKAFLDRWNRELSRIEESVKKEEFKELLRRYIGKSVTIITKDCITTGKSGTVETFDCHLEKFKVDFNNGFVGWYTMLELKLED